MSTDEPSQDELQELSDRIDTLRESTDELRDKERGLLSRYVSRSTNAFDENDLSEMDLEVLDPVATALMDLDPRMESKEAEVAANASGSDGPGKTVIQGSGVGSGLGDALRSDSDPDD